MDDSLRCLLCGRPLPEEEGLSQGPLFCERHLPQDLLRLGVFDDSDLGRLSAAVAGHAVREASLVSEPYTLILFLEGGDLLLLFPSLHRSVAAQYVPESAIRFSLGSGRISLEKIDEPDLQPGIPGLRAAIDRALPLLAIEHGVDQMGGENHDALTLRFSEGLLVDVESVGWSFFSGDYATQLALRWRTVEA